MFYTKKTGEKFNIPGGTEGILYPSSPNGDQTIAIVEMDGVYPKKGYSINDFCTETIVLVSGYLEVEVSGEKFILKEEGDMIRILPNNKYRVVGKGKSIDMISPNWDKNQNHFVD